MPCCIIAEIIWFFVNRYGKTVLRISLASLLICALGLIAAQYRMLDFAMINRAMVAQFFLLIGFLMKKREKQLSESTLFPVLILCLLYIGMGFVFLRLWPDTCIDVHLNRYYNVPFSFIMITAGCLVVFRLGMLLESRPGFSFPRFLLFLGQNTLTFYLLHEYNIPAFVFLLSKLHISLNGPVLVVAKLAAAYVLCSLETIVILRFFPWILGKRTHSAR